MFIKKFFPLALLLCLGLTACEQDHVSPPIDPNSPAAKATANKTEGQPPTAQNQEKKAEEPVADSPREDKEVKAPEKKTKEPVKLTEKQTKELAKCNNTKQKVTNEIDSGDDWQYITMSEDEFAQFSEKNMYWHANNVYNTKDWKIAATPFVGANIDWNDKKNVILMRRNFCTQASYKYNNPKSTMHARYTGKMDVYINNVLVYSDKNRLPNTGDKYTEIKFDKAPVVIIDLNTISVVIHSKEADNFFDMAIDLSDEPLPPAEASADAKVNENAPANPPKAEDKAPAAPPKAEDKAPAAPPKAEDKAPAAPPKAEDKAPAAPAK